MGCRGDRLFHELYAKGDRKPTPDFLELVGSTAAIIFTVTKDDTTTGATRCLKRMGLLRGDKVVHALPPAQHGMHAHQDGSVDRDHATARTSRRRSPLHTLRHCELDEAIQAVRGGILDCFAPLAMTRRGSRDPASSS